MTPEKLKEIRAENERWARKLDASPGQVKDSYTIIELVDEVTRLRDALEFYADPFRIMDHINGTYEIKETWYQKARDTLAV